LTKYEKYLKPSMDTKYKGYLKHVN